MARTPLEQRLVELELHPKRAFLQEFNKAVYAYLDGPPKQTLTSIAKRMPCSPAALTKWLTGENPIGLGECHKLCRVIGLDEQKIAEVLRLGNYGPLVEVRPIVLLSAEELRGQRDAERAEERRVRLTTMLSRDSRRFYEGRRVGFVGRLAEREEIWQRIIDLQLTGGYLIITGQAGQGKSSIIAKLVEENGTDQTPAYFIRFNASPDEQAELLQHLIATLLLKHRLVELADAYVPQNAQLLTLKNSFASLLDRLHGLGCHEVIFIDGLDQIKPDARMGERDLTFLPTELPAGMVIVLGTRPNDTLKPLVVLAPQQMYTLPPLSLDDFALLLNERGIVLTLEQRRALHTALHGNAFDLDFIARQVRQTPYSELPRLLEQVRRNPQNIFHFALDQLKRHVSWQTAIKPVLGCLLATTSSQPITESGICAVTNLTADQVSEALLKLGDFVFTSDQHGRPVYYLSHLKLIHYLQDETLPPGYKVFSKQDVAQWHTRLADWCEWGGIDTLLTDEQADPVEQERRTYARQHYVTHLYLAKDWNRLWTVLDTGAYGRAKLRHDPSTRSYAQDLDLGRWAAVQAADTFGMGLALLPTLWGYSMLHCSLASRADSYPDELFKAMILLGREWEAIGLAELLTNIGRKASVLMEIGAQLVRQTERGQEGLQLLARVVEIAPTIEEAWQRDMILRLVAETLAQAGQWDQATIIAYTIEEAWQRGCALEAVAESLTQTGQWEQATAMARAIEDAWVRSWIVRAVAEALIQAGQQPTAIILLDEAATTARAIDDARQRAEALTPIAEALVQAGQQPTAIILLDEAATTARAIDDAWERTRVLAEVAEALAQTGPQAAAITLLDEAAAAARMVEQLWPHCTAMGEVAEALARTGQQAAAITLIDEATATARAEESAWSRASGLRAVTQALARVGAWEQAISTAHAIEETRERASALRIVAQALARVGAWEQAISTAHAIEETRERVLALEEVAAALIQGGWREAGIQLLDEAATVHTMEAPWERAEALRAVVEALAQAEHWEQANGIARTIVKMRERALALRSVAEALAQARQWEEAIVTVHTIEVDKERAEALAEVAKAIIQGGQREVGIRLFNEACATVRTIKDARERTEGLAEVAKALAQTGQQVAAIVLLDEAATTAHAIEEAWKRSWSLVAVAIALALIGERERAIATVHTIEEAWDRSWVLSVVAKVLALDGEWERAIDTARTIEEAGWRAKSLGSVAGVLILVGQQEMAIQLLDEAATTARAIEDARQRVEALAAIVEVLSQAREVDAATRLIEEVSRSAHVAEDDLSRTMALLRLVQMLAQVGAWEQAIVTTRTIEDALVRARALENVAQILDAAGKNGLLLELIQQSWLHADTKDYLLLLLPMASGLIRREPEIGIAFVEAFVWVDNFLKG